MRQCSIRRWIPIGGVDTIENAAQVLTPGGENAVKSETVLVGLDFAGVRRRDRIDFISPDDTSLEVVHVAVELKAILCKDRFWQTNVGQDLRREEPLIRDVVDGQKSFLVAVRMKHVQVERKQRRLPVMDVDHVCTAQGDDCLERSTGEEGEPKPVVWVVTLARAI